MSIKLRYRILMVFLGMEVLGYLTIAGISRLLMEPRNGLISNFFGAVAFFYYSVPVLIGLLLSLIIVALIRAIIGHQKEEKAGYLLSFLFVLLIYLTYYFIVLN